MSNDLLNISGPEDFARQFTVSRETLDDLKLYVDLLLKWQKAVNLVAPSTLDQVWHRHLGDSAQILDILSVNDSSLNDSVWLDLGSGGGFPGLVAAILFKQRSDLTFHLVESVGRKCAFLSDVARQTGANVVVHNCRIESLGSDQSGERIAVVSARALASLDKLLQLSAPLMQPCTRALFFKGREAALELEAASQRFSFHVKQVASRTSPDSLILEITGLKPSA